MGLPTMLLRPSTTHRFPAGEMPYSRSISITPAGVQGLANNTLKEGNIVPQILKESVVSLINASIISLVVFIYNFFMLGDRGITASVSLSLFAVVMFASIFGTLVPMTLDKMKIDPALATGPFITITNDIIGMMIYMFITSALA